VVQALVVAPLCYLYKVWHKAIGQAALNIIYNAAVDTQALNRAMASNFGREAKERIRCVA
jgi:hypothetical protein